MLQLLHRFKVKRVDLNPTSKTGTMAYRMFWVRSICSKGSRHGNVRRYNAVQ